MATVSLNGVQLHYEVVGQGEPLLLLPGLGAHSWAWSPVLGRLTATRRCILLDHRGTGRSTDVAGPYRIENLAADAAALVNHLGDGPVDALGWSMGGSVLQEMLIEHPEAVRRAVLLNAFPSYSRAQHAWLEGVLALRNSGANPRAVVLTLMAWTFTPQLLADHDRAMAAAEAALRDPRPTSNEMFARQAAALSTYDARQRLESVRTPTLVLAGAEDILTPVKQSTDIAERIPGAVLRVLPRGSHAMLLEYPEETVAAVLEFLTLATVEPTRS